MQNIGKYSKPDPRGGVVIDLEQMAVDLVTVAKAGQIDREEFLRNLGRVYDTVQVKVERPGEN